MRLEPVNNPIDEKAGEVVGLLSGWTADAIGGRNLIQNGDFRFPGMVGSWIKNPPTITAEDGTRFARQNYGWETQLRVEVEPGDHVISMDVRTPEENSRTAIRASIHQMDDAGESVTHVNANSYGITEEYQRHSITFKVAEGVTSLSMYLLNQDANTGNAYIDFARIKLERGTRATPWTPAPEDSAQSLPDGETPTSPFPQHNPAHGIHTDNSVGTRIFVGDTMIYGDTGVLDIDKDAIKSGRILLSRQGPHVHIQFDQVVFNNAPGSVHLSRIPISYRPMNDVRFPIYTIGSLSPAGSVNIPSSGYFNVYGTDVDTALSGQATFRTRHSWPSSLHAPTVSS